MFNQKPYIMAVYLTKYQNTNTKSSTANMWYYRAVQMGIVDLDALAKHMAAHNTPYSQGCIRGVLKDMCDCIKEILLDGKKVKLGDLAIFSLAVKSKPSEGSSQEAKDAMNPVDNIKALTFNAQATGELSLRGTTLRQQVTFKTLNLASEASADGQGS